MSHAGNGGNLWAGMEAAATFRNAPAHVLALDEQLHQRVDDEVAERLQPGLGSPGVAGRAPREVRDRAPCASKHHIIREYFTCNNQQRASESSSRIMWVGIGAGGHNSMCRKTRVPPSTECPTPSTIAEANCCRGNLFLFLVPCR